MSEGRRDVAIVGGGIAGLMTANRLPQLGTRAVVLERGDELARS
jgi:flavin-dependent dehydrogenase